MQGSLHHHFVCLQGPVALLRIAAFLGAGPANRSQWAVAMPHEGDVAEEEVDFWEARDWSLSAST